MYYTINLLCLWWNHFSSQFVVSILQSLFLLHCIIFYSRYLLNSCSYYSKPYTFMEYYFCFLDCFFPLRMVSSSIYSPAFLPIIHFSAKYLWSCYQTTFNFVLVYCRFYFPADLLDFIYCNWTFLVFLYSHLI